MDRKLYKSSIYNYCTKSQSGYLIYNTLYNSMVRLSETEYQQYTGNQEADAALIEELVRQGLWVECGLDERKRYLACAKAYTRYMPRPLDVTVTTTLKCNARCDYCYEKGVVQSEMAEGSEEKIIEFIKRKAVRNFVHINWFGGEPLLNTSLMDKISQRLKEENIRFSSYIITNGSKVDKKLLEEKLEFWKVTDMQITLDGTKHYYERRKNYYNKEEGDFYRILHNIKLLAEKKIFINIRLNIENDNKEEIYKLLEELEFIFAEDENVVFYPAFITGSCSPMSEEEKVECVRKMLEILHNPRKLTAGTKFYSFPRVHPCMNSDPLAFSVDVNGNVYTCEHHVGRPEYAIGTLDTDIKKDTRGEVQEIRPECKECVFFPKCFGGCESNYRAGDAPCMIEKYVIQAYMKFL